MSQLRNVHPAPVQIWGLNQGEHNRKRLAENRPPRNCATCKVALSRYNSTELCGPCRMAARDLALSMAAHPSYKPEIKQCPWCKSSFKAKTKKRRICYSCISEKVGT